MITTFILIILFKEYHINKQYHNKVWCLHGGYAKET